MTDTLELHITGPDGTQILNIRDEPIRIGRSPDNDIALVEDNTLSRQHCVVELRNGSLYVRDLNSRHGTWTRGKKLKIHRVAEGDVVFAGRSRLMFLPPGAKTPPMPNKKGGRRDSTSSSSHSSAGPKQSGKRRRRSADKEAQGDRGNRKTVRSPRDRGELEEADNEPVVKSKELDLTTQEPSPTPASNHSRAPAPASNHSRAPAPASRSRAPASRSRAPAKQSSELGWVPDEAPEPLEEIDPSFYENPPAAQLAKRTVVEGDKLEPLTHVRLPIPKGWQGGVASANSKNQTQRLLKKARDIGASDVHITVGLPFTMRVNGELRSKGERLTIQDVETLIDNICTQCQRDYFDSIGDYDYCYEFDGGGRYRTNICRHRTGNSLSFRVIKSDVTSLADLGVPVQASRLTKYATGLVLITGPMGAGKTTTMMALAQMVNEDRPEHLISVEDPIEFLLEPAKCQVSQRQLGVHTNSFDAALKAALREDPDIIVIGDMRDYDTTSLAISASETGHLVFASMHAMNCMKTLDKLIDMFPAGEQGTIRIMVSESLRGIICQRLVPAINGGRVPAVELLFNSVAIGNIIRENKVANLVNAMQLGRAQGMRTLDMALQTLLDEAKISARVAFGNAENKDRFRARMLREEEEADGGSSQREKGDYGED
jgi:twitching motility protein PilT